MTTHNEAAELRHRADEIELQIIQNLRTHRRTWHEVGQSFGISASGAQQLERRLRVRIRRYDRAQILGLALKPEETPCD